MQISNRNLKFLLTLSHSSRILLIRNHSSTKPFFVTTPIFYVNGAPHIGHLQSCMFADALRRTEQLLGRSTVFSTGTDEHGLKIQKASIASGKDPLEYCNEVSHSFKSLFSTMDISFTDFIRTTEARHKTAVQSFWRRLQEKGVLYKGQYAGWYDVSDEAFVSPFQVKEVKDSSGHRFVCSETGRLLEKMAEENYIFRLSKFGNDLLYWLSKDVVKPAMFADQLRRQIDSGLQDLSVSRQRNRLSWGIPVPDDPNHTIYVWLDALVNYLTVAGYPDSNFIWPPTCQVIGKDILKFHGLYWPAFLIAAGLEPPQSIFCHSHWTVNYEKMSKSKGNVVDPLALIETYGTDGLRYFLLRAVVPHSDTNYSETKIQRLLNAELADTLGNLLSRCCAPAINHRQVFPHFSIEGFELIKDDTTVDVVESTIALPGAVQHHFQGYDFFHGIEQIQECIRKTNGFVQEHKPWVLAREASVASAAKLDAILHVALEVLRISGLLLQPVIPGIAGSLLDKLGVPADERGWAQLQAFPCYQRSHARVAVGERSLGDKSSVLYVRKRELDATA